MNKFTLYLIGSVLIILFAWAAYSILKPEDPYLARQVKAIAPIENNTLLNVNPHISEVSRPEDHFSFPIPLGGIGPNKNLYSGPNQYPFYCMGLDSGLGQPEVDNQQGLGVPVLDELGNIKGYSKDCGIKTRLEYYTIDSDLKAHKLEDELHAKQHNGPVFRAERGSINRFIYTIVMPISSAEVGSREAKSKWNNRLIYQFNGGSGIGFRQGRQHAWKVMKRQAQQLLDGYAVISSSGNKTSYTYNMLLAEDTARRVKKQFTSLYGKPLYTVGVGGSGGGLAQYLIAQNSKGILDGLLPLYSYPDMITQTTYALDCDLLNNYFTFRAEDKRVWQDWDKRRAIEGMNAINDFPQRAGFLQPINQLMAGFVPSMPKGNSECINGYFGLSAYINNPRQGFLRSFFAQEVVDKTQWSYWMDMRHIFGLDDTGTAKSTWDNVGVQYGLNALLNKRISIEEFLDINYHIGGWKPQSQMQQEHIIMPFGSKIPLWLSLWGNQNIIQSNDLSAQRHHGDKYAMEMAYRSGQVFIGNVDLPIIDARHYLEDELDMHHMSASFYSRLRIQKAKGHHNNHVIWVSHKDHDPTKAAFDMMDKWLTNQQHLQSNAALAKPNELQDSCFNADGSAYAQGETVFNGTWNNQPVGKCQSRFPMYSTSRIEAGASWAGDLFKCTLISIKDAIDKGIYGTFDIKNYTSELENIFPDGVCDYSQGDVGRPIDI